ncbi:MAG: hypothetical protein IPG68_04265 [Micrococcales bacterium]|nr:hypothetical protein [Micrococcales bacterium]
MSVNERVVREISASRCENVLVLSMKSRVTDMEGVSGALAGRRLLYWEGDPWGRGKRAPEEMKAWLSMADTVFSVGGHPQVELLNRAGAARVVGIMHTYDHVLFSAAEKGETPRRTTCDVVFLGSNLTRVPLISGLPGSWQRFDLVAGLRRDHGPRFLLGGAGWPRRWSVGRVPFGAQAAFLRRAEVVANWDHFPGTHAYTSDRLAVAMISGRVQVSTRHPEMDWLPGREAGLVLVASPSEVRRAVRSVLDAGDAPELGRYAHSWAKGRVSHREAVRFMLSTVWDHVEPPPADPWARIPQVHHA